VNTALNHEKKMKLWLLPRYPSFHFFQPGKVVAWWMVHPVAFDFMKGKGALMFHF
jgi:hypothetical protein